MLTLGFSSIFGSNNFICITPVVDSSIVDSTVLDSGKKAPYTIGKHICSMTCSSIVWRSPLMVRPA